MHIHRSSLANNTRHISGMVTGRRRVTSSARSSSHATISHGKCELDSHADTIVADRNCVVLH